MNSCNSCGGWLWELIHGFRASKVWGVISTALVLLVAFIPAVNVVVLRFLSQALVGATSIAPLLVLAGVLFGAGGALQQVSNAASRINALRINTCSSDQFDVTMAKVPPDLYESEEFMGLVRKVRQCLSEGHPSSQFQASINIASAVITAASLAFALYALSPRAALVSLVVPIPTAMAYAWYGRQESRYWPLAAESNRRAVYLQDQFSYRRTGSELSLMNATSTLVFGAIGSRREYRRIREKLERKSVVSDSVSGAVTTLLFIVALVFLHRNAEHSVGAVFAGLVGLMSGVSAMAGVGYQVGELAISMPANRHFQSLLTMQQCEKRQRRALAVENLCVHDLNVAYGDVRAVTEVSFEARRGSLCALVGENGSGKTSLIRALEGVQHEVSGSVVVNGVARDIATSTDWFQFATVQQDYGRYELTVREFVSLGVPVSRLSDEAIHGALRFAEAEEFVESLPHGVESTLGAQWGGVELSGGQWQRLAIARAVLTDAPVWFLDEPTSAVDAPTEQRIFDRLAVEAERRIIILSSHRVSTLRAAANIIVLKKGSVCEAGSYPELMRTGTQFHRMFSSQLEKGSTGS